MKLSVLRISCKIFHILLYKQEAEAGFYSFRTWIATEETA